MSRKRIFLLLSKKRDASPVCLELRHLRRLKETDFSSVPRPVLSPGHVLAAESFHPAGEPGRLSMSSTIADSAPLWGSLPWSRQRGRLLRRRPAAVILLSKIRFLPPRGRIAPVYEVSATHNPVFHLDAQAGFRERASRRPPPLG